jgi:hypothetical protein
LNHSLWRQRDLVPPSTLSPSRRLSNAKQVRNRVRHPGEAIAILPAPRQRVCAGVIADLYAIGRDERPA